MPSVAFGVGHDEDPLSLVRRADSASWNNERPDGVAFTFQVAENAVETHADEPSNILSTHPTGPELLDDSKHFRPEPAVVGGSFSFARVRDRLAREAAGEEGWGANAGCPDSVTCDGADVAPLRDFGPVLLEDGVREVRELDLADGAEARLLPGKVEPADSGEEAEVGKVMFHA